MKFMKKNGGFTLVELIVVIAILAILGGVAVPAYSGYIGEADASADAQLLADVNKAFVSACMMAGENNVGRTDVKASVNDDGTLNYGGPFQETFEKFYEGGQFKIVKNLTYNKKLGMFVDAGEIYEVTVNGKTYYASEAAIEAYLNSEIGKNMTPEQITELAAATAGKVFEIYDGTYVTDLLESGSYSDAVMDIFGMSYQDYMDEQFAIWAEDNKYDLNDDRKREDAVDAWNSSVKNQYDQNLMILASVSQAEKAGETILSDLRSGTAKQTIINNLTGGNGATGEQAALGLSQAALAYGLYVSYKGEDATVSDFTSDLGNPNSDFNNYLNGPTVETDLAGVLGAMSVIGDQDKGTLDSVVANGVDKDADLAAALDKLLGKK